MLLVVGDEHVGAQHLRALEREFPVARVQSPAAARERCARTTFEAVIVDRPLEDPSVSWFVWDLQHGELAPGRVPIVAVHEGSAPECGVDEAVRAPVGAGELAPAVRRAVRLVEYDDAVCQLFEACRWEIGRRSRDLGVARERADECLRALNDCNRRLPFERLLDA